MTSKARIKLMSTDKKKLDDMCEQIRDIAKRLKVKVYGPIPLPVKRLKIPTRTAPDGEGRELYEIWEMRIHKRVLDVAAHEKALRYIMRIPIPKDVHIEMQFID